jgi:DNA-binding MarR family transcriptional regulator
VRNKEILMKLTAATLESQLEKVKDLESRLTFRLSVLSKVLDHQSVELLKGSPLSLTGYRIMNVVETFGAISISDLSRFTALDRAQISRTAENLGKQGLVTFSADPNSKRKKLVNLSVEGRRIMDEVRPKFADRQKQLKEQIGQEDEDALWRGLSKLGEVLGT